MKKNRPRKLRWRLAVPLTTAFALLWLGTMALFTNAAVDRLEQTVYIRYNYARSTLEEQSEIYQNNLSKGLGAEADHILTYNIRSSSMELTGIAEGGIAFLLRDEAGKVLRSQLTYGYGHEAGVDQGQRWYLYFDGGLDDEGQMNLARWMTENRVRSWEYALYPPESWQGEMAAKDGSNLSTFDGTFARVTGIERPGHALDVQKIEIVHPDGSVETMVETATQGENPITLDFKFMRVSSVLLPSYSSNGKDGPIDMELRLQNFREAQAILDREAAGDGQPVQTSGGQMTGMHGGDGISLRLMASQCDVFRAAVEEQRLLYISTFVFTVLVVLILSAYLSRKVTGPVEELNRTAQKGQCRTDGPVKELNTLAAAFNDAQTQLAGQLERERSFTRAAAHELKTPLAILRTHAEALQEDIAPEKRGQYLDVILEESDRMTGLVGRLLELSRLESGDSLKREPVKLFALVREVWNPLNLQLKQKEITLTLKLEEIQIEGDQARLKEAVENLASNALRHCAQGGRIQVCLERHGSTASLRVYNDGPAVPAEDLPHLFEPFYRGDKARNRDSGGTGLGLAIVQAAVMAHGGDCSVENREGGVCFQLRLPLDDKYFLGKRQFFRVACGTINV